MPKTRTLTDAARRAEAREAQIKRNHDIILEACRRSEYGSLQAITDVMGIKYTTMSEALRCGSIRAVDMANLVRLLGLDTDTVLALMGAPERCQYERGAA